MNERAATAAMRRVLRRLGASAGNGNGECCAALRFNPGETKVSYVLGSDLI